MTTHVGHTTGIQSHARTAESRLRQVLLANVAFSVVSGSAGLIAGGAVADELGVDQVWLIRLLGAGLLAFACGVFLVARSPRPALDTWSLQVSQSDLTWVLGTIVVIAFGWLSTSGAIVMAMIAVAVFGFGSAQYMLRQQMLG